MPYAPKPDDYLPHLARLAGITRIAVTSRVGRKTFVTLKIHQGMSRTEVMLATGHQTEKSFIHREGATRKLPTHGPVGRLKMGADLGAA